MQQIIVWRMRIACWIPKTTNTHSQYVTLIAFVLQQRLHERSSLLRHTYSTMSVLFFLMDLRIVIFEILAAILARFYVKPQLFLSYFK